MASQKLVVYLRDEMCAIPTPIVVPMDARSTAILHIERASERSAAPGRAQFEALEEHQVLRLGMASDRGVGRVAGSQAAGDMALWVCEDVHEFRDLCALRHPWERKA